ncbi:MAG: ABC transporter substrate-binding protein [Sulfuricella sp.]|nr:ABC transporter substrate-binding protein [Sulfuricella sp.]
MLVGLFAGLAQAGDIPPDVLVKDTSQDVLAIVKKDKDIQAGSQKKLLDLVEAKVLPHFDFKRMTQLAVGKHWRTATPAQQESLTNEFRTMLVRTYSNSLSAYKNQTIEYKAFTMKAGDTDVTVRTQVIQPGGQPVPINYALEKQPNGWKVYDVEVDGVSLVTNYRGSFGTEIGKTGVDGLIKTLVDKNQTAAKK